MSEQGLRALGAKEPLSVERFGQKAALLDRAQRLSLRVPPACALDAAFAERIARNEPEAQAALARALVALGLGASAKLAVRSSPALSLPGALSTWLDVPFEPEPLSRAVAAVLASRDAPQTRDQLKARGLTPPEPTWLSVLIQEQLTFASEQDFGAVVFTHDPDSGEPGLRGEFARQGVAEVVSGRSSPRPLSRAQNPAAFESIEALSERLLAAFEQPLELELGMCGGAPQLLQVRPLTLGSRALLRLALRAIDDDSPRYAELVRELAERRLAGLSEEHFAESAQAAAEPVLRGLPASPGAASGVVVTRVEAALERAAHEPVVLVRPHAVPEDVAAFRAACAVVTSSGGLTCHAAVIARGLSVPAIVGAQGIRIDAAQGIVYGGRDVRVPILREGDLVSVDARRGVVHRGRLATEPRLHDDAELHRLFAELRKLRPSPLWVEGGAVEALRLKRELSLDGALCRFPEHGSLPEAQGRDCWVEIDLSCAAERMQGLGPGWGVVLSGVRDLAAVGALRAQYPLRALGVCVEEAGVQLSGLRVDLCVLDHDLGEVPQNQGNAARLLRRVKLSKGEPVALGPHVGWLCAAENAAVTALRYATLRTSRSLDAGLSETGHGSRWPR